ncbi:hypothetical protein R6Q57_005420 [Mikania cordata]
MSKRGKRGVASCSKKCGEKDYVIDFNENNQPVDENFTWFMSNYALKCKQLLPYYLDTKDIPQDVLEEPWLQIIELFNIQTDEPKVYLLKKAKKILINFKSLLVNEYVKKNLLPFDKYTFLDASQWPKFRKEKTSAEFVEKSNKARASAQMNKNFAHVGRTGFIGLNEKFDTIWPQIESDFEHIKYIQNELTKLWILSKAKKNKETKAYELPPETKDKINELICVEKEMIKDGTYNKGIEDPLSKVFGPEHGGRTRTVSNVIVDTIVQQQHQVGPMGFMDMVFFGLPNSKSVIFNPNEISGDKCVKSPDRVKEHLLDVYSFHSEKTFFLAPYIASGHWVLFIVHLLKQKGYIVDSINKHKSYQNYAFTYLVEEAFGIKLKWEVVKIWNENKYITSKEIDGMIINLAPQFFQHVFANRT